MYYPGQRAKDKRGFKGSLFGEATNPTVSLGTCGNIGSTWTSQAC